MRRRPPYLGAWALLAALLPGPGLRADTALDRAFDARRAEARAGTCSLPEHVPVTRYEPSVCAAPPGDRPAYMVIGDSVAVSNYLILSRAYPEVYWGQLTAPSCPGGLPGAVRDPAKEWCRERLALGFEMARSRGFDGVVASVNWGLWNPDDMRALAAWAEAEDLRLVVVLPGPRFEIEVPRILAETGSPEEAKARAGTLMNRRAEERNRAAVAGIDPGVRVLDMMPFACPDGCDVEAPDGRPLYLDTHHVAVEGAELTAGRLRAAMPGYFDRTVSQAP